jgi:hypothetical protein
VTNTEKIRAAYIRSFASHAVLETAAAKQFDEWLQRERARAWEEGKDEALGAGDRDALINPYDPPREASPVDLDLPEGGLAVGTVVSYYRDPSIRGKVSLAQVSGDHWAYAVAWDYAPERSTGWYTRSMLRPETEQKD